MGAVIELPDREVTESKLPIRAGLAAMAAVMNRLKICAGNEPPWTPGRMPRTSLILCWLPSGYPIHTAAVRRGV